MKSVLNPCNCLDRTNTRPTNIPNQGIGRFVRRCHALQLKKLALPMVKGAEWDYKNKRREVTETCQLCVKHTFSRSLVFGSGSSEGSSGTAEANFGPRIAVWKIWWGFHANRRRAHIAPTVGIETCESHTEKCGIL